MQQPTLAPSSSTPAAAPAATQSVPAVTRTDGVVSGNTPATGTAGTAQPGGAALVPQQPQGGGSSMMLIMMLPIAALMIFMFMGNRKETKKRAELMAGLQRNDKVQTIGGMIGSIAEINDNEVVLHVDEITKTRVRVSRAAITSVLNRGPAKVDGVKTPA
jgi:preprotein translocase subunit YajC